MIAAGMMSGTSLDGIDVAAIEIHPRSDTYAVRLLDFATVPFSEQLQSLLRSTLPPNDGSTAGVATLERLLGKAYADALQSISRGGEFDYVAMHGQTLYHDGEQGVTLQAGWPYFVRDLANASVIFDFRSADMALGGQGAPLVPLADWFLFHSKEEDRVALNLGGIANITLLPTEVRSAQLRAYDTGPGNMLIDSFVHQRTAGTRTYDEGGQLALSGRADERLLLAMLADPYFSASAPKSTGRERFGAQFLSKHSRLDQLSLEDGAATLAALTSASVAIEIAAQNLENARILVSGGGVHNAAIMEGLRQRLPQARVESSAKMGLNPDAKEAVAFALLGYETLRERSGNVITVTGAHEAAVLGAIAPCGLYKLLQKVESECAA